MSRSTVRRLLILLVVLMATVPARAATADDSVTAGDGVTPEDGPATETVIVDLIDLAVPRDAEVLAGMLDVAHLGVDPMVALDGLDVMAATVTPEGRAALERSGLVEAVREPYEFKLLLDTSTVTIGAAALHEEGRTGAGAAVAIIDSGVDAAHPGLTGSVIADAEACFLHGAGAAGDVLEFCHNGASEEEIGPGAAVACTALPGHCTHGTHVAGIVTGNPASAQPGVAPDAGIVPIRVGALHVGQSSPWISDINVLRAFEHVLEIHEMHNIVAVNLSLGVEFDEDATPCPPDAAWEDAIERLTDAGIAVVASSGNQSFTSSITFPACLGEVISVGATDDSGEVASFTSSGPDLDLLAPGDDIESTVLEVYEPDGYAALNGTSFSAPHVAAAFALVDGKAHFGPARLRDLMRTTGEMIARPTPDPDDRDPRFPALRLAEIVEFEPFPDATHGFWVGAADWAKHAGVSTGIGGDFVPDGELTRAQAVTFLWRFMGSPVAAPNGFTDVPSGAWYEAAVDWAAATGVTTGVSPAVFAPDDLVSRAQLATFMWRTAGSPPAALPTGFADVPPGSFYEVAVGWMAEHEITTGTSPTTFSPSQVVSRAQMVTFEHRLAQAAAAWSPTVDPPELVLF